MNFFTRVFINQDYHKEFLNKYSTKLKVIRYTRNQFAHSFSIQGQPLKRHGLVDDIDNWLTNKNNYYIYNIIKKWVELTKEIKFDLIVRNHSKHKQKLLN